MHVLRTRAALALSLVATASIASAQGCSSKSTSATAQDAAAEALTGEGGLTICEGDSPVLMWQDTSGNLQQPDWSCYAADGAFASPPTPLLADAGDEETVPDATPDVPEAATADATTPDATAPDAAAESGGPTDDTFTLTDFTTHFLVPGATVDIFFGNTLANGATPDLTGTTSATNAGPAGLAGFLFPPPPNDVFGYRVRSRATSPGLEAVVQLDNLPPVTGSAFAGNSITTSEFETLLAGVLGTSNTVAGTTTVVAGARDCSSHELLGATFQLVDDASGQPIPTGPGATEVHEVYFGSDDFPHPECTHTVSSPIALWGAINVPVGNTLRLEFWGRMTPSDATPTMIGSRTLELYANDIMIERAYRLTPLQ
jgi:hypothetical protein